MDRNAPIGVFDSGVGGISVLREARAFLPRERFIYYGDTLNAPYGEKTVKQVEMLALKAADVLVKQGIKALVIACNTATAAAAEALRARLAIPVLGMEPALKTAWRIRHGGQVLVLATPVTLMLPKFEHLMELYGEGAVRVPCPGLMEFVERGELQGERLDEYIKNRLSQYLDKPVDAIVLGCTHYVFLRTAVERVAPGVPVVDGNEGTVRQLKRRLEALECLRDEGEGDVCLMSSGGTEAIQAMQRLLDLPRL